MKRKCRSPTEAETENPIYTDKKRRGKNMELKNRKKKEQLPSSEKNMAGLKKRVVLLTGMGVLAVCLMTARFGKRMWKQNCCFSSEHGGSIRTVSGRKRKRI